MFDWVSETVWGKLWLYFSADVLQAIHFGLKSSQDLWGCDSDSVRLVCPSVLSWGPALKRDEHDDRDVCQELECFRLCLEPQHLSGCHLQGFQTSLRAGGTKEVASVPKGNCIRCQAHFCAALSFSEFWSPKAESPRNLESRYCSPRSIHWQKSRVTVSCLACLSVRWAAICLEGENQC